MDQEIHTLVYSSNRGRYCFDDSEQGHDLTSGEPISIEVMNGVWVDGTVEHSGRYAIDTPGLYSISDKGMKSLNQPPPTEQGLQQSVNRLMREGMSLEEALQASTGPQTRDVFCGYYMISKDGQIIGLCTGMRIRLRS